MQETVQRDQPDGVPPLELTGERTLPDVPEENYWFRRHLAVYEWIAERCAGLRRGRHGLRRGLRRRRARAARAARDRRGREPRGARARPPQVHAPRRAFVRDLVETLRRALRRGRLPPDDRARRGTRRRCCATSATCSGRAARVYVSTPNVLTLAPPGAEKSGNPWHVKEYRAEEFRALCESVFGHVELLGLFHARKLRAHELALRAGWDRVHAALGITKRFYDWFTPAISARDFALREGPLDRALDFVAVLRPERAGRARGARARPPHAHALRRGLRHLAVRRGVALGGGRRRLPPAARRARRRAGDGRPDAGAVRPARRDARRCGRPLPALPARDPRADPRRGRRRPRRDRRARARGRAAPRGGRLRARRTSVRAPRARPRRARSPRSARGAVDLGRDARGAAAAGHRRRPAAAGRDRRSPRTAALRRLGRRLLAARVRVRAGARARAGRARRARLLRRPDRGARASTTSSPVATEAGPVAVPIDWQTVELVWTTERLPGAPRPTATTTAARCTT